MTILFALGFTCYLVWAAYQAGLKQGRNQGMFDAMGTCPNHRLQRYK